MRQTLVWTLLVLVAHVGGAHAVEPASDAPEHERDRTVRFKTADSYARALHVWRTPDDLNAWIAANFAYDRERAIQLSETERAQSPRFSIHTPAELFTARSGVCVDLSRFAVETLKSIDPPSDPKYVMIEFTPMQIAGHTLRRHWVVSFKRDGKLYVFADSKRPGHVAGPYDDLRSFIQDYERYRSRQIVTFRETESYQKQLRVRREAAPAPTR